MEVRLAADEVADVSPPPPLFALVPRSAYLPIWHDGPSETTPPPGTTTRWTDRRRGLTSRPVSRPGATRPRPGSTTRACRSDGTSRWASSAICARASERGAVEAHRALPSLRRRDGLGGERRRRDVLVRRRRRAPRRREGPLLQLAQGGGVRGQGQRERRPRIEQTRAPTCGGASSPATDPSPSPPRTSSGCARPPRSSACRCVCT